MASVIILARSLGQLTLNDFDLSRFSLCHQKQVAWLQCDCLYFTTTPTLVAMQPNQVLHFTSLRASGPWSTGDIKRGDRLSEGRGCDLSYLLSTLIPCRKLTRGVDADALGGVAGRAGKYINISTKLSPHKPASEKSRQIPIVFYTMLLAWVWFSA